MGLDYVQGSFLCILGPFRKVKLHNGRYFWAAKISNILGCLKFLMFFFFFFGEM